MHQLKATFATLVLVVAGLFAVTAACGDKNSKGSGGKRDEKPTDAGGGGEGDGGGDDADGQGDGGGGQAGDDDGNGDNGDNDDNGTGASLDGDRPKKPVKLVASESGIYHGVFADLPEFPGRGDVKRGTAAFESLVGKSVAFSIIGDNWVDGIKFPKALAKEIADTGKLPVIHVKPWSVKRRGAGSDPYYSLDRILAGQYDAELKAYARAVRAFEKPVAIDFAPEMNGNWYPWSGVYAQGGPEEFRDTYRKLVKLFKAEGATNVTWVFHVVAFSRPRADWNTMAAYYPGDRYVDWLAVSAYSAQRQGDAWEDFVDIMDAAYPELAALSEVKPIAVLEYGAIEDRFTRFRKADWISNALSSLKEGRYPRVKAVAYWHESSWDWRVDNNLRVDSSDASLRAYRDEIADPIFIGDVELTPQD
jgi:beta-mannanase